MSRHKTLSRFSIAATAIFFAAIPCLAQAQHDEAGAAAIVPTIIQPTVALNRDLGLKKLIVSDKADERSTPANQPALSPAMLKQSVEQVSRGSFVPSQKFAFEPRADLVKPAGNEDGAAARPLITFVPSRGQKLPN